VPVIKSLPLDVTFLPRAGLDIRMIVCSLFFSNGEQLLDQLWDLLDVSTARFDIKCESNAMSYNVMAFRD